MHKQMLIALLLSINFFCNKGRLACWLDRSVYVYLNGWDEYVVSSIHEYTTYTSIYMYGWSKY
jgi:hypothetical protein